MKTNETGTELESKIEVIALFPLHDRPLSGSIVICLRHRAKWRIQLCKDATSRQPTTLNKRSLLSGFQQGSLKFYSNLLFA